MVAVVIPNYNGMKYLERCLASLSVQSFTEYCVIVVDDCSKDESIAVCKECAPEVTIISREKNGGFSAAVNDGIRHGIEMGAEYIILLNNDTEVAPDFIECLYSAASESEKCFSVQARMLSLANPEILDDAGDFYMLPGFAYARGKGKSSKRYERHDRIFSACAGAAIYKTSVLEEIGLFDEMHFAYLEDVDIGYRARIFGYYNYYEPKAIVYHAGSATSGSRYNEFKTRLAARNSIYLIYKNQTVLQWLLHWPYVLAGCLLKLIFFCRKGMGKLYYQSVLEGFTMSCSKEGKAHKVKFRMRNLGNYIRLEFELWWNLVRKLFGDR